MNIQIWWLLLFRTFRRFCRLLKWKKICKGEKGRSCQILSPLSLLSSSSLISFSSLWYSWWYCVTKFDLVQGNGSLRIKIIVRSNLFSLFNLCFVYWMFFGAYFSWLSCLITMRHLVYYSLQSTTMLDIKCLIAWSL